MPITDEQFTELHAKYGRVARIHFSADAEIVIRAPTRAEYKRCRAALHQPATAPEAQEDLVRAIVVACNDVCATDVAAREAFDKLLDVWPGLCENKTAQGPLAAFTGLDFAASGKG